jgi:aspartyl-tRNA(Asn)/glutamyl-tRNA(Gln) amidotransferase subunit A
MDANDPTDLSLSEAAGRIANGALTPSELLEACLRRIAATDDAVHAWVSVDEAGARAAARERTEEARAGRRRGPLHGIPVAIKDIFHVAGMTTTCGAAPAFHAAATADATSVARLRAAGAVVLGKAHTTEFAYFEPAPTRNPWNPAHTPGGSSSGSAAAVGARMAPLALGTQTVGSVLRPAAYCGVVGFKPTHGRISAVGVVPLAWSLDHVGVLCRSVEDAALALAIMAGHDAADPHSVSMPLDDYIGAVASPAAPRLGVLRPLVERAEPDNRAQIDSTLKALRAAGAQVEDAPLAVSFAGLPEAGDTVMRAEAAAFHRDLYARHAAEYPVHLGERVKDGHTVRAVDYLAAQAHRRAFRSDMAPVASRFDALVSPTAPGPAPKGLAFTGDASFCAPWSSAGMPSISLPTGLASDGLPFAVQLTGAPWAEARLLAAAAWCERVIGFAETPRA